MGPAFFDSFDFRGIDHSSPTVLYTIGRFLFLVKWIRSVAWYIRMVPRLFPNTSLPKFRLGMTVISSALFHPKRIQLTPVCLYKEDSDT